MLASELRFLIPSESLPRSLRFCPSVLFLPNGISVALVEVTPRTQRSYLTTIRMIVLECRRILESFFAVYYFKKAREA
jgi:hypothetical protein